MTHDTKGYLTMFRIVFASAFVVLLSGCAGVSSLTVDQVRALSNIDVCYLNSTSPVGFIPLELQRRKLDCTIYEERILNSLVKAEEASLLSTANVPPEMLNQDDCKGIRLGQTSSSYRREGPSILGGRSELTTTGYYQDVHNEHQRATFVLFAVSRSDMGNTTKFIKIPAQDKMLIRFGNQSSSPRITLTGCRSF